jgi:DNA-directed RNA polymerase subunit M/transcription elongation factor TFIIS
MHKHQWTVSHFRDCPDCGALMYYCNNASCRYYKCSKCKKQFEIIDGEEILRECRKEQK